MQSQFIMWLCWGFGAAVAQILLNAIFISTTTLLRVRRQKALAQQVPQRQMLDPSQLLTTDYVSGYPYSLRPFPSGWPCTNDARSCTVGSRCQEEESNASITRGKE